MLLFLTQSICAIESEQTKPRVFSFFKGGHPQNDLPQESFIKRHVEPDVLNAMTDEQKRDWYFNFCLENWKKKRFKLGESYPTTQDQSSWTKEAREDLEKRRKEVFWSAINYSCALQISKPVIANYASYLTIDPVFQAIADRIPITRKSPVTVRDLSVPVASFLLGAGIERADLALGHALFNKNMKRKLSIDDRNRYAGCKNQETSISIDEGIKDFKAAATVSLLRIFADQVMQLTGVHDELNKLKRDSEFLQGLYYTYSYIGRPMAQLLVLAFSFRQSNYEKYANQPNHLIT
jgi:hypothetical protein